MTTYKSDQVAINSVPRFVSQGSFAVYSKFSLSAALTSGDVIRMCRVAKGTRIIDFTLYCDQLDTAGSPAITLDIGDTNSAARYSDDNIVGQTGGFVRGIQTKAGFGYQYTDYDYITLTVGTSPTTGATTGDIKMVVTFDGDN